MFSRSSQRLAVCSMLAATSVFSVAPTAQAGPVLDWLLNRGQPAAPAYPVGPPVAVPAGAATAGFQQQVSSRVPVPSFGSNLNRAAVTYYRPVVEFDPVTGTNVTRLRPCTSFELQNQRVPTLSARPAFAGNLPTSRFPSITAPSFGTTPTPSQTTAPSQPSSANLLPTTNGTNRSQRIFGRNRQFTPPAPYVGPSIAATPQPTLTNGAVNYSSGFAPNTTASAPSFGFGQLRPIVPNVRPSTARSTSGQIAQSATPQNAFPQSWNLGAPNPAGIAAARPVLPPQPGLIPVGPPTSVTVPAYSGTTYGNIPAFSSPGTVPATSQFPLATGQNALAPNGGSPAFSNAPLLPVPTPQTSQSPFVPAPTTTGSSSRPFVPAPTTTGSGSRPFVPAPATAGSSSRPFDPAPAAANGFGNGGFSSGLPTTQPATGSSSRPAFQNPPQASGSGTRPISITTNRPSIGIGGQPQTNLAVNSYGGPSNGGPSNGGWEIDPSRPIRELGPVSSTTDSAPARNPARVQTAEPQNTNSKSALPPAIDNQLRKRENFGGNDPEANIPPRLDDSTSSRTFDFRSLNRTQESFANRDSVLPTNSTSNASHRDNGRNIYLHQQPNLQNSNLQSNSRSRNEPTRFGQRRSDRWNTDSLAGGFNQAELGSNLNSRRSTNDFSNNRFGLIRPDAVNPVAIDRSEANGIELEPANVLKPAPIPNDIDARPKYNQTLLNARDLSARAPQQDSPYRSISRGTRQETSSRSQRSARTSNDHGDGYRPIDRAEQKQYGNAFLRPGR